MRSTNLHRGFTLAEVLATIAVMAIVLPVIMQAVSISTALASATRLRAQGTYLAEMKLADLLSSGQLQTAELSGDFGAEWPGFKWEAEVSDWDEPDLRQVQLYVTWFWRGQDRQVVLSTLFYDSAEVSSQ